MSYYNTFNYYFMPAELSILEYAYLFTREDGFHCERSVLMSLATPNFNNKRCGISGACTLEPPNKIIFLLLQTNATLQIMNYYRRVYF